MTRDELSNTYVLKLIDAIKKQFAWDYRADPEEALRTTDKKKMALFLKIEKSIKGND